MSDMKFDSFFSDVISNIIGGGLLTLLFFILREKVYKTIELDGSWVYEQTTEMSEYNPFNGMKVRYLALVAREGNKIYGSAEKIYEKTAEGIEREYTGKHRTCVKVTGHIEKNYLSKDRICIHITEFGELRESSTFQNLAKAESNKMNGRFSSTIANQQGLVEWTKRSS